MKIGMLKVIFGTILACLIIVPVLFYLLQNRPKTQPDIISVVPMPNSTGVGVYQPIKIKFSRSLAEDEKKTVLFSSFPSFYNSLYWSTDNTEASAISSRALKTNQSYSVKFFYLGKNYSWDFKTASLESLSVSDQTKLQGEADYNYAASEQKIANTYPWLDKLPPPSNDFFIAFDTTKKAFFVDLYPKKSSSISIAVQTDTLKNKVKQKLQLLNVDPNLYPINWSAYPE